MFKNARLKIERANHHISNLDEVLKAFVAGDFYEFVLKNYNKSGEKYLWDLHFDQVLPIPREVPLIIGDAVHNLRSALDMGMCNVVFAFGGVPTKWTRFRFFEDRHELEKVLGKGILNRTPDLLALVAGSDEFYEREDNPHFGLHTMDIADKHEIVLPVISTSELEYDVISKDTGRSAINGPHRFTRGVVDTTFTRLSRSRGIRGFSSTDANLEIDGNYKVSFEMLFANGAFQREPVIPTLNRLSQLASSVIDKFENWAAARA